MSVTRAAVPPVRFTFRFTFRLTPFCECRFAPAALPTQARYFRECPVCYKPLASDDPSLDPFMDVSHERVMKLKLQTLNSKPPQLPLEATKLDGAVRDRYAALLPHCCHAAATLLPHCYHTAASLLPHCYHTAAPLPPHCC